MRRFLALLGGSVAARTVIALLGVLGWIGSAAAQVATSAQSETFFVAEVKAAFLFNFGTFVQWPEESGGSGPLTIAVLGDPAVAFELMRLLPGRSIQGRPVRVRSLRSMADFADYEMLYVGPRENYRLGELVASLHGRATLVVADAPDALTQGAMINFRLVENRMRFEISVPSAELAGLRLSSRLLAAAERVETGCAISCLYRDLPRFTWFAPPSTPPSLAGKGASIAWM